MEAESGCFTMNLRQSARRAIHESRTEYESTSPGFTSTPAGRGRKRVLDDASTGEDTPARSGGVRRERVKRVKGEKGLVQSSDSMKRINKRRSSQSTRYFDDEERGEERENEEEEKEGRVRRSKREKRLLFASFNLSEMNRQLLDPHHGFPVIDDSEDDLEPYEKLLSPRRTTHPGKRVGRTRSQLDQANKVGGEQGGEGGVVKTEAEEGEERLEGGDEKTEEAGEEGEESSEPDSDDEDEENSRSEDEGVRGVRGYFLRKRRPVIYQYQPVIQVVEDEPPAKKRRPRRSGPSFFNKSSAPRAYQPRKTLHHTSTAAARKKAAHQDSSTTSSGSDSDEARFRRRKSRSMQKARMQCLPMNFDPEDVSRGVIHDRVRIGSSLADVDPMNVDRKVTFESVGGLKHHVRALKEMIIFPLLYPEVFDRFKIQPPRGVLFYGPPGCGKTLLARALANECSKGGKTVAFFMRKGADCLSKWVGESERQLRLLFDQAYQMRPSIIFFDEIDGLAPVRSSRQDQIHSSIVSTLLALMDGLDSRGEIVIIGATNRIDAIDPALRRPGRFDREFLFPLPSREDRHSILSIHTKQWKPALRPDFIAELADATVGYCGADLRSLCTEASLHALRRQYPQIYQKSDKLVLDVSKINISAVDFHNALKAIVPTAQRSDVSVACALPEHVRPLLLSQFQSLLSLVSFVFPPSWKSVSKTQKALRTILISEENRRERMHTCIDEMGGENVESLHNKVSPSVTHDKNLNNGLSSGRSKTSPPLPGSKVNLSTPRVKAPNTHSVIQYKNRPWNKTSSETNLTKKSDSASVSSVAVLNSVKGCKRTSNVSHLRSALVSTDHDLCQLSQASQPAELEEVYFDTNDHETVLEREKSGAESILLSETTHHCQEQSAPLASPATQFLMLSTNPHTTPLPYNPRLILCGLKGMGQTSHLGPALMHTLEDLPIKTLDLSALFASSTKTPEEACIQVFREARRVAPSVVFIPRISSWWGVTTETFQAMFLSTLHSLPSSTPILMLATSECPWGELPAALREVFEGVSSKSFAVHTPSPEQRKLFFSPVLLTRPTQPPPPKPQSSSEVELETLPVAPPPEPRKLTEEELRRMDRQREAVLRELRVFLRDATNKLLAERKFKEFVNPVNPEEVPDYYDIILEPMDLGTIMKKIDEHRYTTPRQWIAHVDLITRNALEYNPEHDSESRLLRHRAVALQDMAHSILDHELSEDFEKQCEDIEETYQRLGRNPSSIQSLSLMVERPMIQDPGASPTSHTNMYLYDPPRRSLRQKGLQPIIEGLPYYAPPKPRTPRKQNEEVGSREASPFTPNENGEDGEMEHSERVLVSESEEEVQKKVNSGHVAPGEKMDKSTMEQSGRSQTDEAGGEGVVAERNGVQGGQQDEESLKLHQGKAKSLKNAQVRRKILKEDSSHDQQQANAQTPESNSLPSGRHTRRRLSSVSQNSALQDSVDSSLEIFVRDETGSMEASPVAAQQESLQPSSCVDDTNMDEATPVCARQDLVIIDRRKLLGLFERVVHETESCSVEQMEDLYFTFEHLVFRHRMKKERSQLLEDLEMAIDLFVRSSRVSTEH